MKILLAPLALYWIAFAFGNPVTSKENDSSSKAKNNANDTLESVEKDKVDDIINRLAINARPASYGEYPYQVSMQIRGQHHCGGALISRNHVLTAAHCVYEFINNPYQGAYDITIEVGSVYIGSGQSHRVRRLACSRNFVFRVSPTFLPNDVAVITLQTPAALSDHVKFINLPEAYSEVPRGSSVVVTGFGNLRAGGPTSPVLRKTVLYTVSSRECYNYGITGLGSQITDNQICARGEQGAGTCQGDSGGPMMHNRLVIGIVSGGNRRCGDGQPDIFTKVSHYIPFIQYEMGDPTGSGGPSRALDLGRISNRDYDFNPSFVNGDLIGGVLEQVEFE